MLAFLENCRRELSEIELSSDRIEELTEDRKRLFERAEKLAAVLTEKNGGRPPAGWSSGSWRSSAA
jgi:DNA repair ATPase RecN